MQGNVDLKHTLKSYYLHLCSVSIGFGLYSLHESTFQQETRNISCDGSRSPTGRIGDFTLLFCRGSQRNEPHKQSLFLRCICFVAPFSVQWKIKQGNKEALFAGWKKCIKIYNAHADGAIFLLVTAEFIGGIWKRNFHSETASNVFRPHDAGEFNCRD